VGGLGLGLVEGTRRCGYQNQQLGSASGAGFECAHGAKVLQVQALVHAGRLHSTSVGATACCAPVALESLPLEVLG
jgi:hypothetical protein